MTPTMRAALCGSCAVATAVLIAAPAAAQEGTFMVTPATVAAGGSVTVSGDCGHQSSGFAISRAFRHTRQLDFAGVAAAPFNTDASGHFSIVARVPATRAPGSYGVTVRCGGGTFAVSHTLRVVPTATLPKTGSFDTGALATGAGLVSAGGLLLLGTRRRSTG